MKATGNRKNIAFSSNDLKQVAEMARKINLIRDIVNEPDPHAEKYKSKISKIQELLK